MEIKWNSEENDVLLLKLEKDFLECDLIIDGIKLAIAIFFSEKSKQVCLHLNVDDSNVDDIIFEFKKKTPIIRFMNFDSPGKVIYGNFDDHKVDSFIYKTHFK